MPSPHETALVTDSTNPYTPPGVEGTLANEPRRSDPAHPLRRVATGLRLVTVGMGLLAISLLATVTVRLLLVTDYALVTQALIHVADAAMVAGSSLCLLGPMFCLDVPEETSARGPLITAAVLLLLTFPAYLWGLSSPLGTLSPAGLRQLVNLSAGIFFAVFLRQLARWLDRSDLARRATMIQYGCLLTAAVLLTGGSLVIWDSLFWQLTSEVGLQLFALLVLLFYLALVEQMRKLLRR